MLCFQFGGLQFEVRGDIPQTNETSFLPVFTLPQCDCPDVTVEAQRAESLSAPEDAQLVFENSGLRVFDTAQTHIICYRDTDEPQQLITAKLSCNKQKPDDLALSYRESPYGFGTDRMLSCLALESILLRKHRAALHAACVNYGGQALLFSGRSGVGKSTQAELWQQNRGTQILNGDKTLLSAADGPIMAQGLPFAGSSGICERFSLPTAAIVFLSHADTNCVCPLSSTAAVKLLLSQMPVQAWDASCLQNALNFAVELAEKVQIIQLACLPDASAVDCLDAYLKGRG